jgi:hypothetical protein
MNGQVRLVLFAVIVAALLPMSASAAQIKECSVARPSNSQEWWSWRLIDGRKCWYAGRTMISKSLLQWPAEVSAQARSDTPSAAGVPTEKRGDPLDAQARLPDDTDSFESRWRARAIGD